MRRTKSNLGDRVKVGALEVPVMAKAGRGDQLPIE